MHSRIPLPPCATLPDGFGSGGALGAADLGCVDTSHAGPSAQAVLRRVLDGPRLLRGRAL